MSDPHYIELHARSAFSFLRSASLPEQLAEAAAHLELPALAVCDRMGVYGAPRLAGAAKEAGIRPIVGVELAMDDGSVLPVLVESRAGYRNLCTLLTRAHLRAPKGEGTVQWDELAEFAPGLVALTGDAEGPLARAYLNQRGSRREEAHSPSAEVRASLRRLLRVFGADNVFVEVQRHRERGEERVNQMLTELARAHGLPLLATNGVLHAAPEGRQILDVFTCLRHHTTLDAAGRLLSVNRERHLKGATGMAALFADLPEAITNTQRLAERLNFTLADLGYEFPKFPVGPGETMEGVLREWVYRGAKGRYGNNLPEKVQALLTKELTLINKLGFAGYFLIVADLVRFCRENDILAQGRGSAANSAACYCLGITAVDPLKFNVLFERFLTESRKGWPDIDIDLPSGDRRERVIQEVYRRYGPHGAAMTATVITYRGRSSARELGKVLGLPLDVLDRFSGLFANGDFPHTLDLIDQMDQAGLPRTHPRAAVFAGLYQQLRRLPRHLGQHSGGMIICQGALNQVVPLENAAMPGRVVAQWDKDDCEDLGIIKMDLLGLGMMAALQDMVTLTAQRGGPVDLAQLPENDPETFALMQRADTIGVFQIESRAQMATLPRMKPKCFYDLVIEVAIIRPGPIQGDLAHPYLRRHNKEEAVTYFGADDKLKPVLERTLGVPLFQEQMLEMAMVLANFSGDEAEELRRAMSFHRSEERMRRAETKLRVAMDHAGVKPEIRDRIVKAVSSFALYGFPESHAISFAHLAYASAYLKTHRAPEFFCALLNNQPMGFYSAATLVKDAKRHGVQVRPVCIVRSEWDTTIETESVYGNSSSGSSRGNEAQISSEKPSHAGDQSLLTSAATSSHVRGEGSLRLGLRQVQGMNGGHVQEMLAERTRKSFDSMEDLRRRTAFSKDELRALAEVGALNIFSPHRRAAMWEVERTHFRDDLLATQPDGEAASRATPLRQMDPFERTFADYSGLRLTTGPHPMALIRERLPDVWRAADLKSVRNGQRIRVAGQVICRQRPGTAKGVCFVSLEDETGISNAIVAPKLFEEQRLKITTEPFLVIEGIAQSRHNTIHIQARQIERLDYTGLQTSASHDFG